MIKWEHIKVSFTNEKNFVKCMFWAMEIAKTYDTEVHFDFEGRLAIAHPRPENEPAKLP